MFNFLLKKNWFNHGTLYKDSSLTINFDSIDEFWKKISFNFLTCNLISVVLNTEILILKLWRRPLDLRLNVVTQCHCHFMLWLNSLAPWRSWCDFENVIFNLALLIFKSYDNVLRWMPQDLTDDKSTLVQVMAWCRQATLSEPMLT